MSLLDVTIADHHIPLAARDYGGRGAPLLLLHGLGGTLEAWDELAAALTPAHRVVAMDIRGHGHSGDGPWQWEAVLDDVEAVVRHFDLGVPAVVGHSLGGMLALMWALRHPEECPAIVNLDGLRSAENVPENYPGMAPDALEPALAGLKSVFDAQAEAMAHPLPADQVAMHPKRALLTKDGGTYLRPNADLLAELRYSPRFRDAIPLVRQVRCPALIVIPTKDPPGMSGGPLMAAFRRGVRRDLLPAAEAMPNVRVLELDASHAMVTEKPKEIAELINDFLPAPQ